MHKRSIALVLKHPYALWLAVTGFVAVCVWAGRGAGPLALYPDSMVLAVTEPMNAGMLAFSDAFGWIFRAIAAVFDRLIHLVRAALGALPWAAVLLLVCWLAFRAAGGRKNKGRRRIFPGFSLPGLPVFAGLSVCYMVVIGYWPETVNSFALVAVSVPLAVLLGFAVGVRGFKSARARKVIMPCLDLLQTVPAFAYLLPILLLFGFGAAVGLFASILYAFPPMVRNTIIGLRAVSPEVIEAGTMSGATPFRLFWSVRVPSAKKQLLLGVNQATMAGLSMVIIASIIGGTNDIGWEVLVAIRKAQFGESLLAGLVIALMAMLLDRMTAGFALHKNGESARTEGGGQPGVHAWLQGMIRRGAVPVGCVVLIVLAVRFIPALSFLDEWPKAWRWSPAPAMNEALNTFIAGFRSPLEAFKNTAFFYLMLPVKIGFKQAVSPFTWGFAMTPLLTCVYAGGVGVLAALAFLRRRGGLAFGLVLTGLVLYGGLTGTPWVALGVLLTAAAWQAGGRNLALGTALGLSFLLLTGIWQPAMVSLYLCGVGVLISCILGGLTGIWASENNLVSAIVRPVIDTLQTMPLFVILIPFIMVFKIGEFTALLAIVAYSIVPAIRYTEHGLRNLPVETMEAATMIGSTRIQRLLQVKLPLAFPSLMLGLNQTLMFAISMLVITALVGTSDLGQQIYIGLGDGDFGVGMTAGIGMAIIAMIADRMTQAVIRRRRSPPNPETPD